MAPGDDVLGARGRRRLHGELLRWGLVPHWADSPAVGVKTINARAETVAERPAYRDAFARRCLIVADGFYEWEKREDGPKQPWWVTLAGGEPFAFAGLWASWRSPEGERLRSCAIVTTRAAERIAQLHDRMPVILDPEAEAAWLAPETEEGAQALLRPIDDDALALRAVGRAVNDARYDGPECLAPPAPPSRSRSSSSEARPLLGGERRLLDDDGPQRRLGLRVGLHRRRCGRRRPGPWSPCRAARSRAAAGRPRR